MAWDSDVASPFAVGDALPTHNEGCMVCGSEAIASPLLGPWRLLADERVGVGVRFDERHQGAPAYAHGGAVAAVLDDAMGYVSFVVMRIFVTAHLEVDYRRPVLLGHEYRVEAWCEGIEGRKVRLATHLLDEAGTAVAQGTGLFLQVELEHFRP